MSIYLVVTPFFPTADSFRGAFVFDQVRAIERTKRYGKVVVMRPCVGRKALDSYWYDGIEVHYFPVFQLPSNLLIGLFRGVNERSFLNRLAECGVRAEDVEVVHSHVSMHALYALAVKKRNPRVLALLQHHDPDPYSINMSRKFAEWGWNTRVNSRYLINLYNKIDIHVVISQKVLHNLYEFPLCGKEEAYPRYKRLLGRLLTLRPAKIRDCYLLYNGVDVATFHPGGSKEKNDVFTIGSVGNFLEWKSQITLLKAARRMKEQGMTDFHVILIGSGVMLGECQEYVKSHALEECVEFRTEMPHENLPEFYRSLDLFVLPSYFEGFGCVFTEAYACGVPFITCKNQGVSELVDDPEKWLIEKEDDAKLAELIVRYKTQKYPQMLKGDYEIDKLIPRFVDYLKNKV